LCQQQLKPLLHLPGSLIGKGDSQDLARIGSVLSNEVGDAMGESTRLPTTGTSHHQQRPLVVIHRPALGVVEACQKAHGQNVRARKQEAIRQSIQKPSSGLSSRPKPQPKPTAKPTHQDQKTKQNKYLRKS
jgi:cell division septation protein DedD